MGHMLAREDDSKNGGNFTEFRKYMCLGKDEKIYAP
jgi:hypothetical protein